MAKFITRVSVYVALAVLVPGLIIYLFITFYPAYFLGAPTDYYLSEFQYDRIKNSNYPNIIIGDSRGNASVNPKELGSGWINLSIPGSDLFEGFYTLKQYLRRNKPDTLIMIYGKDYIEGSSPFFNERTVPYQFVSLSELHDLASLERRYGLAFHDGKVTGQKDLLLYQFNRELRYSHFPFAYRETFFDGLNTLIQSKSETEGKAREIEDRLRADLGHLTFGNADSSNATLAAGDVNRHYHPDRINLAFLDSTMGLAAKNNIVTYLIIAPINRASYVAYKNSIQERSVDAFLNDLAGKYPRMHLLREPVFLENSFFGDAFHLNNRGTILYSTNLRRILSKGLSQ